MVLHSKIDLKIAEKFRFKAKNFFLESTLNKNADFCLNCRISLPSVSSEFKMLGVFWKIQKICSKMGTRILKIDLEMTEIIDPEVGNPLKIETKSAIKMIL